MAEEVLCLRVLSSLSKNAESLKIHKNLADAILYKV